MEKFIKRKAIVLRPGKQCWYKSGVQKPRSVHCEVDQKQIGNRSSVRKDEAVQITDVDQNRTMESRVGERVEEN